MTRTLKNSIIAMLINSGAPANYWHDCLYAAVDAGHRYVRGMCSKPPEELISGVKPSVEHLRTFDCNGWSGIPDMIRQNPGREGKTSDPVAISIVRKISSHDGCDAYGASIASLQDSGRLITDENVE